MSLMPNHSHENVFHLLVYFRLFSDCRCPLQILLKPLTGPVIHFVLFLTHTLGSMKKGLSGSFNESNCFAIFFIRIHNSSAKYEAADIMK